MMEYLYKGKCSNNGAWIEGLPFIRKDTMGNIIDAFIIQDIYEQVSYGQKYIRSDLNKECFRVIPETIGQYTGVLDINKNKIFEDDIVKFTSEIDFEEIIGKVSFVSGKFGIMYTYLNETNFHIFGEKKYTSDTIGKIRYGYKYEKISNIHDDPNFPIF